MYFIRKIVRNKKGATAIEYGLIAALVAVAAIVSMKGLAGGVKKAFDKASTELNSASTVTT